MVAGSNTNSSTRALVAELRVLHQKSLTGSDPSIDTPVLLAIAVEAYPTARSGRLAILQLLRSHVANVGDNPNGHALRALFGLDDETRSLKPHVLRASAAAALGLAVTSFRRRPLTNLLTDLAERILEDAPMDVRTSSSGRGGSTTRGPESQSGGLPRLQLKILDRFGDDLYEIRSPEGEKRLKRGQSLSIGAGGAGTVYCAMYRSSQLRAIKFLTLNYLDEEQSGRKYEDFRKSFQAERDILYPLSHPNIAKLHDSGSYTDRSGVQWEYLATEYVAGPMLEVAIASEDTDGEEIYRILTEVLSAISYLHRNNVFHGDIKKENIKLRSSGPRSSDTVLLDLGTAHAFGDEAPTQTSIDLGDEDYVRFITTRRLVHQLHREFIDRRIRKSELRDIFPSHDLHSLGILLKEVLGPDSELGTPRERLRRVVGDFGIVVLDDITSDLLRAPEGGPGYKDIFEVARDIEKLHPNYLSPAGTPELSLAAEFQFSIPTATGRAVVTPRLARVINHKVMQRLRNIPQLEYTSLKFPGATHTRLSHSVAVLRNARYSLAHLLNDARFRRMAEPADLQATLLLAILHDVGHFPLSHMFEDFATDQRLAREHESWRRLKFDIPTDDDLFMSMVAYDYDETQQSLRGNYSRAVRNAVQRSIQRLGLENWSSSDQPLQVRSLSKTIIEDFGFPTYEAMVAIHSTVYLREEASPPKPAHLVLGAVISSDIDADKTAYLVEDADRTGVQYGRGVDLDGILGSLCMPSTENLELANRPVIGIIRSGITPAQSVAVSRNEMLTQVYWNPTNRAATAMIKFVVARLLKADLLDMPKYIEDTLFSERETAMWYLFDKYRSAFDDADIVPLAGLLDSERRIYKRLFETSSLPDEEADEITDGLVRQRFDDLIALEDRMLQSVRAHRGFRRLRKGEIVIDYLPKSVSEHRGSGAERSSFTHRGRRWGPGNSSPALHRCSPTSEANTCD